MVVSNTKPDVIIIGAGVIGTACAYYLSRRGARVRLLEQKHLAAGASGASAAMINISGTPEPLRAMNVESHRLIARLDSELDGRLELTRGGSFYVAMDEDEVVKMKALEQNVRKMGAECRCLDGNQLRKIEPLIGPKAIAGLFNTSGYHVNPFKLCEGYVSAAKRRECEIGFNVAVQGIRIRGDKIDAVITSQGDVRADWVVVAAGANTPALLSGAGIELPIFPARGQVIITEACAPTTPYSIGGFKHLYAKQNVSGNFYLGSHTEDVGFDNRITMEKLVEYMDNYRRLIPFVTQLTAIRFFSGFRPLTKDELPVIGPMAHCPRLIVASGHGRTGMRYSASTGKAVSELIFDGAAEHSIDAFSPNRFLDTATQAP